MSGIIDGINSERFASLRDVFAKNFTDRGEMGASLCVSVNGETVADLWGGMADTDDPWTRDTVSTIFSCTKAATALCAHMLIERDLLNPAALVSEYWPEFAQNGKENTTVQMMLNHESGVPAFRDPIPAGGFNDWDYMIGRVEQEEAHWPVGTRNGYHMVSFGWTVGELVRRVSGKSLGEFFRDEIAAPLGIDYWIGLPDDAKPHIAPIIPHMPTPEDMITEFAQNLMTKPDSIQALSFMNTGGWSPNDPVAQKAQIGGAGGISNARGQVAIYKVLANGGSHNGVTLLSADYIDKMRRVSTATQIDATLLVPTRFASGFMKSMDNRAHKGGEHMTSIIGEGAFGHVGAGGSIGFADPDHGLAFSYTMNKMGPGLLMNDRGQSLINKTYEILGVYL